MHWFLSGTLLFAVLFTDNFSGQSVKLAENEKIDFIHVLSWQFVVCFLE